MSRTVRRSANGVCPLSGTCPSFKIADGFCWRGQCNSRPVTEEIVCDSTLRQVVLTENVIYWSLRLTNGGQFIQDWYYNLPVIEFVGSVVAPEGDILTDNLYPLLIGWSDQIDLMPISNQQERTDKLERMGIPVPDINTAQTIDETYYGWPELE